MTKNSLLKMAILNDLLNAELTNIDIPHVLGPVAQSKLRNMKKSTDMFVSFIDKTFGELRTQEVFGELCDNIDELVNESIGEVCK